MYTSVNETVCVFMQASDANGTSWPLRIAFQIIEFALCRYESRFEEFRLLVRRPNNNEVNIYYIRYSEINSCSL
jgi:hypothetical protein